jgi:AcrR family transcriptional regulator
VYINSQVQDPPVPLTRQESQARTRRRLIDSAARLFARNGIGLTTIREIAEGAGHTRGAFYAHFESKDELCMTMLEERFDRYLERFSSTLEGDDQPDERARRAGDQLTRLLEADPDWRRLSFELGAHAAHDESFRRQLVERYRSLRAGVAEVFRSRANESGVSSPVPLERLALMTFAISTGITTCMLLEPEEFGDELHGDLLAIFFVGLQKLGEDR